jgi:hypothetical protein
MLRASILASVAVALLWGGCGGQTDEQQLRSEFVEYSELMAAGEFADACRRVTNPAECITRLREQELVIGGRAELLVATNAAEAVKHAGDAVIKVDGDRAVVDNPATDAPGLEAVRQGGSWRLVFPTD